METILTLVAISQTVGLVVLAYFFSVKSKQARECHAALADCSDKLDSYSGIEEAENHLQFCKEQAQRTMLEIERFKSDQDHESRTHEIQLKKVVAKTREFSTRVAKLKEEKAKLEIAVKKYQRAVGDFKSVSRLRQHIAELQKNVGLYETAASLQARIEQQNLELQQCAKAMQVASNAQEILSKATYYENLVAELKAEVESLEETRDLQQFGIYRPQYSFEHSNEYREALDRIVGDRKQMVKAKQAVSIPPGITVAGDERAGKKLGDEYAKVMLRAFNGEADADILKAKYNNMEMLHKRMTKSRDQINKLGQTMGIAITEEYLHLRILELRLAYEWERKKQQEREEQAFLREQAREEEKARKEAARAEREAAKEEEQERKRLAEKEIMLAELRRDFEAKKQDLHKAVVMSKEEGESLRARLAEQESELSKLESQRDTLIAAVEKAHERREVAISLAQLTKRGYVYILSNIGSFGEDMFKIGMSRRENPNERVKELASASVPFPFDIHAMVLTDDAPALENKLHDYFADRRVNRVNPRKEFYNATIEEIQAAVKAVHSTPIEFKQIIPEAAEFRESQAIVREERELALAAV